MKPNLFGYTFTQVGGWLSQQGKPSFVAGQIYQWLYVHQARSFEDMTNLSKALRAELARSFTLDLPQIGETRRSADGTVKFLVQLGDGKQIEAVLLDHGEHHTLCISTQVGCAMGCKFCVTATLGLIRNLKVEEIIAQVLLAHQLLGGQKRIRNLVFMGMGEPLHNYEALIPTLEILEEPKGLAYPWRRITLSTSGLIEPLKRFWAEPKVKTMLAISLNGVTQEARKQLMPVSKGNQLADLIQVLKELPLEKRQRITFEYVLLKGVTDSLSSSKQLVSLLNGIKANVNLIPFNPDPVLPYEAPTAEGVAQFQQALLDRGLQATVRKSRGQDVSAACGQLAAKTKTALPT